MERFICVFLLLTSQLGIAELTSPILEPEFNNLLLSIELHQLEENSIELSEYAVKKLQSKQIEFIQYFANDEVSDNEKTAVMATYQLLNQALDKLGLSQVDLLPIDQPIVRGSGTGTGTGFIRGFVRNEVSETPLQGAAVYLYDSAGIYQGHKYTDAIGRYFFSNLEDGQYLISASHNSNYLTEFFPNYSCPGGLGQGCQPSDLIPVELIDSAQLEQINFSLEKQGKITGYLIDQNTQEPFNGQITLYNGSYESIGSTNSHYQTGAFTIYVPNSNPHYLGFSSYDHRPEVYEDISCENGVCDFIGATAIIVNNSDELDIGNIVLATYNPMTGQVTDSQTGLVPSHLHQVELLDANTGYYVTSVYPESDGQWSSGPLPEGSYRIRTRANNYIAQYYQNTNCTAFSYHSCESVTGDSVLHNGIDTLNGIDFSLTVGGVIKGQTLSHEIIGAESRVVLYDESGSLLMDTYSNYSTGDFEFQGLGAGTYYLSASNTEHQATLHPNILCSDARGYFQQCYTATEGSPINLTASGVAVKNIQMRLGAKVSGRINDTNNSALENAQVYLTGDQENYNTYTDDSGNYEFNNVKAGTYRLHASHSGHARVYWPNYICPTHYNCDETQGNTFTVSANNSYNNKNLNLPLLGQISVNVKNRANQAAVSGRVSAYDSDDRFIESANLDNSGQSTFDLYPGNYYFVYDSRYSDYLNRVYGSNQSCYEDCQPNTGTTISTNYNQNRNISMTVDDAYILSGSINGQAPINNNWKYIKIYQNDVLVQSRKIHSNSQYEEVVKLAGSIKIEATQEGHFSEFYQGVECYGEGCGLSQATVVNVIPNQSKNIDFNLNMLSHVKGQIVNSDNEPLAGIQVEAFRLNRYVEYSDTTDADGRYELYGLSPNSYNIRALTNGNYESTLFGNQPCPAPCQFDEKNAIEIQAGDFFNNRNITMGLRGGIKINTAEFANGDAAAGVWIQFFNQDSNNSYTTYSENTDENGNTDEIVLPAGNYRLLAKTGGYGGNLYTAYPNIGCSSNNLDACLSLSPSFLVNSETSHVIDDFTINQNAQLSIQIFDDKDSSPISGALVEMLTAELELVNQSSSVNGVVEINNISPGSYYVFIATDFDDAHQSELYDDIDCNRGLGIDCLLSEGSLLEFDINQVQNLTVALKRKPTLMVNLKNAYNGESITGNIRVYSTSGSQLNNSQNGSTIILPMNKGQYYITGSSNGYNTKAYPNALCESSYDLYSCALNNATTITITDQDQAINLGLDLTEGINGRVTNAYTGEPIEGVVIDFWRTQNYIYASTITNQNGQFSKQLNEYYDYLISTDMPSDLDLYNEVYNNQKCFEGPAVIDMCDPEIGEWIEINGSSQAPQVIEFKLDGDPIFHSSFELN